MLEDLDEGLDQDIHVAKYVDDITLVEIVPRDINFQLDSTGERPKHTFIPPNTQTAINSIARKASEKHMKLNKDKTQILTISSTHNDCDSYLINDDASRIESSTELKMLGFHFTEKPTVALQIDTLIRKANKRAYLLAKYKSHGVPTDKLKVCLLYTSPSPRDS